MKTYRVKVSAGFLRFIAMIEAESREEAFETLHEVPMSTHMVFLPCGGTLEVGLDPALIRLEDIEEI